MATFIIRCLDDWGEVKPHYDFYAFPLWEVILIIFFPRVLVIFISSFENCLCVYFAFLTGWFVVAEKRRDRKVYDVLIHLPTTLELIRSKAQSQEPLPSLTHGCKGSMNLDCLCCPHTL